MQPTHFRAYAADGDVHNPVAEGDLEGGDAKFKADSAIDYVVFYDDQESPAVVGRVDGPFGPGKVAVSLPEPAE